MLPKETNVTIDGLCSSSQTKDVSSSCHMVFLVWKKSLLVVTSPSTLKLGKKIKGPTLHQKCHSMTNHIQLQMAVAAKNGINNKFDSTTNSISN
jgi:hypothetical protein